jgi:hypothetical protein
MRIALAANRAKVNVNARDAVLMQSGFAYAATDGLAVNHFPHWGYRGSLAVCFHHLDSSVA